jgi:hypothetical protein
MSTTDPRYKLFERNPPAVLNGDEAPMSDMLRYMRLTAKLFDAFGWQMHPIVHTGYLRWSAPAPGDDGYVLSRTYAETSGDCAHAVNLYVGDIDDCDDAPCEAIRNDLELFTALAATHRDKRIGKPNGETLVEALAALVSFYGEGSIDAITPERFAATYHLTEIKIAFEKLKSELEASYGPIDLLNG